MNRIDARVTDIKTLEHIAIVSFEASGQPMKMMALALNLPLNVGEQVTLGVKASHVSLAKSLEGVLSLSNQLRVVVDQIEQGALLSQVRLMMEETPIECVITSESVARMKLKEGDAVIALIKASELSIIEVVG